MRRLAALGCLLSSHRWIPYGPPPRYRNYLPPVERCTRCHAYRHASGEKIARSADGVRPYLPDDGGPRGWVSFNGHGRP
ncbi:MAG TPA: hypothetical protein VGL21_20735 [Jatrophihabitantaceae bacterium]